MKESLDQRVIKLERENSMLRKEVSDLKKALKKTNRKKTGELRMDYKLMVALQIVLDLCNGYEFDMVDKERIKDKSILQLTTIGVLRGEVGKCIRPKDVTAQFVLDLINKAYEETGSKLIGQCNIGSNGGGVPRIRGSGVILNGGSVDFVGD